jgi:hypothetical protein
MPIANCIINPELSAHTDLSDQTDIISIWSKQSGVAIEHMTINFVSSIAQLGKQYQVMATLQLPSIWSQEKISILQLGLATTLSKCFSIPSEQVHVVTSVIDSGLVVENGEQITW